MNDILRMDFFIKAMADGIKQGYNIDKDIVYANLIRLGTGKIDKDNFDIHDMFSDWINEFKDVNNIDVFVSKKSNYFCIFENENEESIYAYNKIKMYIPLDKEHIYEGANRLFKFMAENNMSHNSKIARKVRFDDIVLRIDSKSDASKIEEFVMNDKYIQEGMIKHNPFAFHRNNIAYAWDGRESFNTVLSQYISNYINGIDKNKLDKASYKDFAIYLSSVYNDTFIKGKNIDDYALVMGINGEDYEYIQKLVNYEGITKLLVASIMPDKSMDEYYRIYLENIDNKHYLDTMNRLKGFVSNKKEDNILNEWNSIYDSLVNKYGYYEADFRLLRFMQTGDYLYFTKDGNIRERIINNNIDKETIKELIIASKEEKRKVLKEATYETLEKYNVNQAIAGLRNIQDNEYFQNFTGENNRKMLKDNIRKGEIFGLMIGTFLEEGIDINNISADLMENSSFQ